MSTEQSVELFKRAGQPADLHLMKDINQFMITEDDLRVVSVLREWLEKYFRLMSEHGAMRKAGLCGVI